MKVICGHVIVIWTLCLQQIFCEQPKAPALNKKLFEDVHNVSKSHHHSVGLGLPAVSPEQNKQRLAELCDKMDVDGDSYIDLNELQQWIDASQKKYLTRELDKLWKTHNPSAMQKLSWDEYRLATYAFLDNANSGVNDNDRKLYENMQKRDRRRWSLADTDGDQLLSKEEFAHFLHPEKSEHMKHIVIEETMQDVDKDGDGRISINEYIRDLYAPEQKDKEGSQKDNETSEEEPDWIKNERQHFKEHRDLNGDGFLDLNEIKHWLAPAQVHSEAEQLIQEADADGNGKLSKQEILDNYDLFISSEATEYGEALTPVNHDEL